MSTTDLRKLWVLITRHILSLNRTADVDEFSALTEARRYVEGRLRAVDAFDGELEVSAYTNTEPRDERPPPR